MSTLFSPDEKILASRRCECWFWCCVMSTQERSSLSIPIWVFSL